MLLNAFHLHFLFMSGVLCAATDNIKTVTVMLGGSVTLHTDIEAIEINDHISWLFGSDSPGTRIAEIIKWSYMFSIYVCHKELFGDQLQLNRQTGSLTIKNISTEHSGLYKLTIINQRKTSYRRFSIKVYAPLAVPVITNDSSHYSRASERSSGSECVLLCSVRNISRGTLSFYKGNDLLSNISGADPSTILSLSLEVEHYDKNLYSCVVNNFITNQTTQINITDLCQPHSEISLLYCLVLLLLIPLAVAGTVWILCAHRKHRKAEHPADEIAKAY